MTYLGKIVRGDSPATVRAKAAADRWHLIPATDRAAHDANGKPLRGPCPYVRNGKRCVYFSALGDLGRPDHPGDRHHD